MSAKGRKRKDGSEAEKPDHEFFPTPSWCVTRLLQHVDLPGGFWLEPSAGDGAIIRAVQSQRGDVTFDAVELRVEARPQLQVACGAAHVSICDFLRIPRGVFCGYEVAIGNPPFSSAADFVIESLVRAREVVMLLRLNFLGSSNDRRHLFETAGMPDVYVLPERPSFTGEGTDACEYAWMRWIRGRRQKSEVRVLFEKQQLPMFSEAK